MGEELVCIIVGFVFCVAVIIALIIVICCYDAANYKLRKENSRLRRTLEDYYRLEQASLNAHTALALETQRYMEY